MALFNLVPGLEAIVRYLPARLRVLAALHGMPSAGVYFVNSVTGADAAGRGTRDAPLATWDYAYTTADGYADPNVGDIIVLMAGHAQTLSAAGAVTIDVAGVEVVGLGQGANVPTITFANTAASVLITAASTKITNVRGVPSVDSVTNPFHVQAADCTLGIEWRDASATIEAVRAILTTAAADRLKVRLKYWGFTTGDAVVNAIRLVGVDGADIDIEAFGLCSTAWVEFVTTACTNVHVTGRLFTQGITNFTRDVVDTVTGSTWSAEVFDASAGAKVSGGSAAALAIDDISVVAANLLVPTADVATNTAMRDVVGNKTDAAIADTIEGAAATTQSLDALAKAILQRLGADSANNTAATTLTASNADGSVLERQEYLQTTQNVPVADAVTNVLMRDVVGIKTDAGVQAVTTTASLMAYIKAILDQLSGTAGLTTFPAEALAANAVSLAEVLRWIQNGVRSGTGTALATNESLVDVLYAANGIAVFPAAQLPANNVSIAEVLREAYDQQEKAVVNTTAALVNGTTIFTIAGGPIEILSLVARCVTGNDGTASTLQWSADPTDGAAVTFSGASASLANALAGAMAILQGTALSTAPTVNASGVGLSMSGATPTGGIIVGAGIITTVMGVGSTTGTWQHHLRYRPLSRGVTVT